MNSPGRFKGMLRSSIQTGARMMTCDGGIVPVVGWKCDPGRVGYGA
jgi:hypothetical protein